MARSRWTFTEEGSAELSQAIRRIADKELRTELNGKMRDAATRSVSKHLIPQIRRAAMSATPQAGPVSTTVKAKRDRFPSATVGGARRVTRSGAPAGAILWVAERGGPHAPAPRIDPPGGYFIAPAVKATIPLATREHAKAATQILAQIGKL